MTERKVVKLEELARELGAFSDAHIERLKNATLSGIMKSIPMLVERSPIDTGLYAQSWGFQREEWGAILGNYAPHAPIIEYGARPFTPPIGPLLEWANRVLRNRVKDPETGEKFVTGPQGSGPDYEYSSDVWALAKTAQKKIAERGIQPRHIMEDAIPEIIENIKREFENLGK